MKPLRSLAPVLSLAVFLASCSSGLDTSERKDTALDGLSWSEFTGDGAYLTIGKVHEHGTTDAARYVYTFGGHSTEGVVLSDAGSPSLTFDTLGIWIRTDYSEATVLAGTPAQTLSMPR